MKTLVEENLYLFQMSPFRRLKLFISSQSYLSKDVFLYFGAYLFGRVQAFLTIPLLAYLASTKVVGQYELFTSVSLLLLTVVGFNVDSSLSMLFYTKKEKEERARVLGNCLLFSALILSLIFIIFYSIRNSTADIFRHFPSFPDEFFYLGGLFAFISYALHLASLFLRLNNNKKLFSWILLLQASLLILPVIFWRVYGNEIKYLIIFQLVLTGVLTAVIYFYIAPIFKLDTNLFKRIFKLSMPLIPFSFFSWILLSSDRLIVKEYWNLDILGEYGVINRLATVVSILGGPFQLLWLPFSLRRFHEKIEYKKTFQALFGLIGFGSLALIGCVCIALWIYTVFHPLGFALNLVAPLAIANIYLILSLFPTSTFLFTQKAVMSSWAYGIGAVLCLAINYLLIPRYGLVGAVLGCYVGYGGMFAVAGKIEASLTAVGYKYKELFSIYTIVFLVLISEKFSLLLSAVICFFCAIFLYIVLRIPFTDYYVAVSSLWRGDEKNSTH